MDTFTFGEEKRAVLFSMITKGDDIIKLDVFDLIKMFGMLC